MSSSITSPQSDIDAASASGSDSKKRNKLGYHRTAVACGHCRRRKIRCIPSPDQTECRCQNCIRLKKECQFYPVEGNDMNTAKSRSGSRVEIPMDKSNATGESPSPELPGSATSDLYSPVPIDQNSSGSAWSNASTIVASSSRESHNLGQQQWNRAPGHNQLQGFYPQHDPHTSPLPGSYWPANEVPANLYSERHFDAATTSASYSHNPQMRHANQAFNEQRHAMARQQSFSGMPGPSMTHSPASYRQSENAFPGLERSMTMPAVYHSVNSDPETNMSVDPHVAAGQIQFAHHQGYPSQLTPGPHWYPATAPQGEYQIQYLPSQPNPDPGYSQYPS